MWRVQVFPDTLTDISRTGHDGQMLAAELLSTFAEVEAKAAPVKVIACTTDAAADCRKGRRIAAESRPDVAYFDCFSHQASIVAASVDDEPCNTASTRF